VVTRPGSATLSQIALNWVARRAGVASVLIGARTDDQFADNLAAANWSLSDAEIGRLDEVSATRFAIPTATTWSTRIETRGWDCWRRYR